MITPYSNAKQYPAITATRIGTENGARNSTSANVPVATAHCTTCIECGLPVKRVSAYSGRYQRIGCPS